MASPARTYSASIIDRLGGQVGTDPFISPSRLAALDGDHVLVIDSKQARIIRLHTANLTASALPANQFIDEGNVSKCPNELLDNELSVCETQVDLGKFRGVAQSCQVLQRSGHGDAKRIVICDNQCNVISVDASVLPVLVPSATAADDEPEIDGTLQPLKRKRAQPVECIALSHHIFLPSPLESRSTVGWSGIGLHQDGSQLQCVSYLEKSLLWMNLASQTTIRRCTTVASPTAISAGNATGTKVHQVIAEGLMLSIWDQRQGEMGGCAVRENVCRSPLYAVSEIGDNDILCAGADRTVYLYDVRTMKAKLKWRSPCKYDIVKLLPAGATAAEREQQQDQQNQMLVYVAGSDNEVMLCNIFSNTFMTSQGAADNTASALAINHAALPQTSKLRLSHHRGVRAESRWLGLDVVPSSSSHNDTLVGLCDLGKFYVVMDALNMKVAV